MLDFQENVESFVYKVNFGEETYSLQKINENLWKNNNFSLVYDENNEVYVLSVQKEGILAIYVAPSPWWSDNLHNIMVITKSVDSFPDAITVFNRKIKGDILGLL